MLFVIIKSFEYGICSDIVVTRYLCLFSRFEEGFGHQSRNTWHGHFSVQTTITKCRSVRAANKKTQQKQQQHVRSGQTKIYNICTRSRSFVGWHTWRIYVRCVCVCAGGTTSMKICSRMTMTISIYVFIACVEKSFCVALDSLHLCVNLNRHYTECTTDASNAKST